MFKASVNKLCKHWRSVVLHINLSHSKFPFIPKSLFEWLEIFSFVREDYFPPFVALCKIKKKSIFSDCMISLTLGFAWFIHQVSPKFWRILSSETKFTSETNFFLDCGLQNVVQS